MKKGICYIGMILCVLTACSKQDVSKKEISFYHWKAKADYTKFYDEAIETCQANKIYMHYFDIESVHEPNWYDDGIYPTYVLKSVAKEYRNLDIVPVVYITNNIFKTDGLDIVRLAGIITELINQISLKHFDNKLKLVQIDCDWTTKTKSDYFRLLKALKKDFELDVTIRLHQIKFQDKTGIPPANKGTLMLYNMGDLRAEKQNSILESNIVKQYINKESTYPMRLKIALPLFSQTVITNNNNKIKLIRHTNRANLENDRHFKQISSNNFQVVADTLYKGFYLAKGYNLKLEDIKTSELVSSYNIIKESQLNTDEIIFYHLDNTSLLKHNLTSTIEKL
ncbi:hypothetical protein L3073_07625 [Ancylomarina sp. DW003]|nr:hypothetical protein [Ancylomarina sp. DW003]MDE5422076.1 hypothetical protein [Ancylomarina sp. DW003]